MSAPDQDDKLTAYLARFGTEARTPLLSFVAAGHPFSVTCVAEWVGSATFHIVTKWPSLRPSDPACGASLLWHYHDDKLDDQFSLLLQGWLRSDGTHTVFEIAKQPDLTGLEPIDEAELFRKFDRNADKYLADNALEPPPVNKASFETLISEARDAG